MIRFEDVHKAFGKNRVLRGCSLDVRDGETLTIIGGSGTGKSVTLKLMLGLLKPDSGHIVVDGQDITEMTEEELSVVQKNFSYVFQGGALFDSMTVGENVAFGLQQMKQHSSDEIRDIVKEKLAVVGLQGIESLKPSELSGGMRKRVSIARSIAMSPKYLFYDEPTTGLDPIMSDVINDLIVDLHKKLGQTGVVITHDMRSAYKISSRVAMLYQGQIVQMDTPENIKNSTDPIVQQFVTGSAQGPIQMKLRAYD
jgi:phospholipid/cholesterol/gamma-HCH transport system ATP-binding protein